MTQEKLPIPSYIYKHASINPDYVRTRFDQFVQALGRLTEVHKNIISQEGSAFVPYKVIVRQGDYFKPLNFKNPAYKLVDPLANISADLFDELTISKAAKRLAEGVIDIYDTDLLQFSASVVLKPEEIVRAAKVIFNESEHRPLNQSDVKNVLQEADEIIAEANMQDDPYPRPIAAIRAAQEIIIKRKMKTIRQRRNLRIREATRKRWREFMTTLWQTDVQVGFPQEENIT